LPDASAKYALDRGLKQQAVVIGKADKLGFASKKAAAAAPPVAAPATDSSKLSATQKILQGAKELKKDVTKADQYFKNALSLNGPSDKIACTMSYYAVFLYERAGKSAEALQAAENAYASEPQEIDVVFNLCRIHNYLGNADKAKKYAKEARALAAKTGDLRIPQELKNIGL